MRRKVDLNQSQIVRTLHSAGCGVLDLSAVGRGCPDLLVHGPAYPHSYRLVEIKNLDGRGNKLTPAQIQFHARWRGSIVVVESVDQALAAMGLVGT